MDIIIVVALFIIALCMVFGRPLNITITYKHINPPLPEDNPLEALKQQEEENEEVIKSMDAVVHSLQEIMGVNINDDSK